MSIVSKSLKCLNNIPVVILCGGLGTRLRKALTDRPKALAPLGEGTFLDFQLKQHYMAGFRRFVFCLGYRAAQLERHLVPPDGVEFQFSIESEPLGTGGALKRAGALLGTSPFLVLNGDSYCQVDYEDLVTTHVFHGKGMTLVVTRQEDASEYGTVQMDSRNLVTRFSEKNGVREPGWINAGIYLMNRNIFTHFPPEEKFSLEHGLFPQLASSRECMGHAVSTRLYDIGTPERLELFQRDFGNGQAE